jgi:hypothetical protein
MPSTLFGHRNPRLAHLVQRGKGGLPGEIADLRLDTEDAFLAMQVNGGYIHTDEFTNVAAADVDGITLAAATAATPQAFTSDDWDGVLGTGEMVPPRNATITTTADDDVLAVECTITGRVRDFMGLLVAQTDTITLTAGGGVTNAGTKAFSFIDAVNIPANDGAAATLSIGWGVLIGMSRPMRSMAGLLRPLREVAAGSVVTNGTFAATAPNGTYSPNSAPNGTNDYALTYVAAAES